MQPSLNDLFRQLGLPDEDSAIEAFIARARPEALGCSLSGAPCWSPAQAAFLQEAIAEDADWAVAAEQLTARLCR